MSDCHCCDCYIYISYCIILWWKCSITLYTSFQLNYYLHLELLCTFLCMWSTNTDIVWYIDYYYYQVYVFEFLYALVLFWSFSGSKPWIRPQGSLFIQTLCDELESDDNAMHDMITRCKICNDKFEKRYHDTYGTIEGIIRPQILGQLRFELFL